MYLTKLRYSFRVFAVGTRMISSLTKSSIGYSLLTLLRLKQVNSRSNSGYDYSYDPELIPSRELMQSEGVGVLEEWFRWGEEWSTLLRLYGKLSKTSAVLEIGCGLGRIAFPLRYLLFEGGTYDGFEICRYKIDFLERFHQAYPNFRFQWADVYNTHYNPIGKMQAKEYQFPYAENSFDTIFAASVFTHLLPDTAAHYFKESARVLKPGGRCVFSFFLLDFYRQGNPRPGGFSSLLFNIDHAYGDFDSSEFVVSKPSDPAAVSAHSRAAVERFAREAGLELVMEPVPGVWSGTVDSWMSSQDIVVLAKR